MAEVFRRELGVEPGPARWRSARRPSRFPVDPVVPSSGHARPAPGRRRTPLPAERTRLIGRDADLDAVAALLGEHRIVTITGPGGAGKSTLALAVARRLQSDGGRTST